MNCKQCPKCGARWLQKEDGTWQLYWATGKEAKEVDLAGLVCNKLSDDTCINPAKGDETGTTWEKRMKEMEQGLDGL